MSRLTSIQNKIQVKVFDNFGSSLTITPVSSTVVDKWGDSSTTYGSSSVVQAIPYNLISARRAYEGFGDLSEGSLDVMLPHDTVITINDKVEFDSTTYKVVLLETYPFADGNLAIMARLSKELA